jgi:type I restriction enzyme R subunit
MYFSTYQAIAHDEIRPGLYRDFPPDFFDLIIVDECHRGSAREESNWREILEYFSPAVQLGMTATPLRDDNKDTYRYFGNPIYNYSLRDGIDARIPRAVPRPPHRAERRCGRLAPD